MNTPADIDALVGQVRDLAEMARAAVAGWNLAYTVYDEGEEPEPTPPDDERTVLVFLNGHVDIGDREGRDGGGWGHAMGFFDRDQCCWYVHGKRNRHVTHWTALLPPPALPIAEIVGAVEVL